MKKNVTTFALLLLALAAPAGADAPPGRYELTADVVYDTVTGLSWQRTNVANKSWTAGASHCAEQTFGGLSGWRLPTVRELQTILDETRTGPALDTTAFPGVDNGTAHWTATTAASDSTKAWMLDFSLGLNYLGTKTNATGPRVRCVR